jgi:hypothetical protein
MQGRSNCASVLIFFHHLPVLCWIHIILTQGMEDRHQHGFGVTILHMILHRLTNSRHQYKLVLSLLLDRILHVLFAFGPCSWISLCGIVCLINPRDSTSLNMDRFPRATHSRCLHLL